MRSWVGIEVGKVIKNVCCVVMCVRVSVMCCGGDDSSQSQSSTGDLGEFTGIEGQSGKNMCQGGKPDTGKSLILYWYECMWHLISV